MEVKIGIFNPKMVMTDLWRSLMVRLMEISARKVKKRKKISKKIILPFKKNLGIFSTIARVDMFSYKL